MNKYLDIVEEAENLWMRFRNGDQTALEALYKKNYNLLYNYGLKLLNNPVLVQDFIQEIFYKLCKQEHYSDISNLRVYLLKSMRNTIYDYYTAKREFLSIDDMSFSVPEDDMAFETFFAKGDEEVYQWKSLLTAINNLPNQQKQILYLYYIKGLSHKEISEIMSITSQSSMNALSKGIKRLRTILRKDATIVIPFLLLLRNYSSI